MLLIDGVKYEEWIPPSEDEFEKTIMGHAQDIFGKESVYFDLKKKLVTKAGIGSIPDGYVIALGNSPQWYIVEAELSSHPLYEHIVPQVTKFINGIKSFEIQREIANALDREISTDPSKKNLLIGKIGSGEVYRFISNLISEPPIVVILIEQKTHEIEEVCESLPIEATIVEFRTFKKQAAKMRDGVIDVRPQPHAHLFEPLYEIKPRGGGRGGEKGERIPVSTEELLVKHGTQPFNRHGFKGTLKQAWDIRDHPPTGDRNNWTYDIRVELLKLAGLK